VRKWKLFDTDRGKDFEKLVGALKAGG